jgi:hypothetical protein
MEKPGFLDKSRQVLFVAFLCRQINPQQPYPLISPNKSSFSRLLIFERNPVLVVKSTTIILSYGKTGFLGQLNAILNRVSESHHHEFQSWDIGQN